MKNKKNPLLTGLPARLKTAEQSKSPQSLKTRWAREGRKRGARAELVAVWLLRLKGYRIIGRNMRLPGGEIDIVAKRGRLLVFVEVKSRRTLWLACQAVAPRQWRRIEKAAGQFVAARGPLAKYRWRFDVVALARWRKPRHIVDAWRPPKG